MRKRSFSLLLTVIAAAAVIRFAAAQTEPQTNPKIEPQGARSRIVAYYFHGTHRCATCLKMEQYAKEAIDSFFTKELKDGSLEFRPVNTDDEENRHFIKDFQLYTRSLVLVRYDGDALVKYENLPDIWSFASNRTKFHLYVKNELQKFMKDGQ